MQTYTELIYARKKIKQRKPRKPRKQIKIKTLILQYLVSSKRT